MLWSGFLLNGASTPGFLVIVIAFRAFGFHSDRLRSPNGITPPLKSLIPTSIEISRYRSPRLACIRHARRIRYLRERQIHIIQIELIRVPFPVTDIQISIAVPVEISHYDPAYIHEPIMFVIDA